MAGRASIVGAAATHVGKVREHNEDAHFFDAEAGVFLVCDGMGGHAAGEVASALAVRTIRTQWASEDLQRHADAWLLHGTPDAKKQLLAVIRDGVLAAHAEIIAEAERDDSKAGMGTTLVGGIIVGNELVFAHAGDSRAYLVRDAIAMQLTEDHTLLARLLAAGIDVDISGEGSRFRSMLTNALGIGQECKVSTFVVPLADGDRFLFCSDGISEYVKEAEIGEVLSKQPSPARAAQKLIELALDRGGGDNATTIVVRVLEAGEAPQPAEQIRRENAVIDSCPLWGTRVTPQQRLRALRIAISRDYVAGERLPAQTLGDRVAWIIVDGELVQDGVTVEPGTLVYPESLVSDSPPPDRDGLAVVSKDVRALALRADDFRELCEDDSELGEALLEGLAPLIANRRFRRARSQDRADTEIDSEITNVAAVPHVEPEPEPDTVAMRASKVSNEFDARFDAMCEPATSPPVQYAPTTERIPLTIKPRTSLDSGPRKKPSVSAVGAIAIPLPPGRAPSKPSALAPTARAATEPGVITTVRKPIRPPSEPDIETLIEIDAELPTDDGAITTGEHASLSTKAGSAAAIVADDEPTAIRQPIPADRPKSANGTTESEPAPRAKRLSEGWDE